MTAVVYTMLEKQFSPFATYVSHIKHSLPKQLPGRDGAGIRPTQSSGDGHGDEHIIGSIPAGGGS